MITWGRQGALVADGFVVNVTRGLNTRSRFLPNGKLSSHTLRELTPGQHYHVTLTAVKNAGQEQLHSTPQRLAFTTCERRKSCNNVITCCLLAVFECVSLPTQCQRMAGQTDGTGPLDRGLKPGAHWARPSLRGQEVAPKQRTQRNYPGSERKDYYTIKVIQLLLIDYSFKRLSYYFLNYLISSVINYSLL